MIKYFERQYNKIQLKKGEKFKALIRLILCLAPNCPRLKCVALKIQQNRVV